MKQSYTFFNILCLGFIGGFAFATLWFWRGEIRAVFVEDVGDVVTVVSRDEFFKNKEIRNEEIEETIEDTEKQNQSLGENKKIVDEDSTTSTPDNEIISPNHCNNEQGCDEEATQVEDTFDSREKQLPPSINLAVPFTSQAPEKNWDQPWQDACEEAAVLMLDAYYKEYNVSPLFAKDELWKMVKWEEERGWGGSIEIEKIRQVVEEFILGKKQNIAILNIRILENPTVEDIKRRVASGNPVLVVAEGKTLPNPHFQNGGPVYHALIIRGYTETEFITNDPGTQHGENFRYKYDDLMNSIRDWNGGDVKRGRRVVLVLE